MQRLEKYYLDNVVPFLINKFGYSNIYKIPSVKKIVINRGFDDSCQNTKILDSLLLELVQISGQKPSIIYSKKAISNFKIRENSPIGMKVTLRGDKMYSFLDRLINLSLPRIRDFQGLSSKSFDHSGNYSFGLSEQSMFSEIEYDKLLKIQGMDIVIVTNTKNKEESFFLLKELGFPLIS